MARVLSHEYGHHFTTYHLVKQEKMFFDTWEKSGYAKFRDPKKHPKITYQNEYENNLYRWDIQEIAAEDYVQLLGSPRAKESVMYNDISQKISKGAKNNFNYIRGFNMNPQENKEIPLAADILGLENYWRALANLPKVNETLAETPKLELVLKKEIAKGQYQYRIEWVDTLTSANYEYTLIAYPAGPYVFPYPIKTVKAEEENYAILGNGLKFNPLTASTKLVLDDYRGKYVFILYVKDNNKVYSSKPLEVNFNYPVIHKKGIYKDVHPSEWAAGPVETLFNNDIMVGSTDKYFSPLKEVTFDEIITVMDRMIRREYGNGSQDFLNLCVNNKLMNKNNIKKLEDKNNITREDAAYIAYNYMKLKYNFENAEVANTIFKDDNKIFRKKEIGYLANKGIIKGYNKRFYSQNNITRQELASIIVEILIN